MQTASQSPVPAEEMLRLFIEGVRDYALLMLDPEGRIVSWNEGAESLKGYRADEIIGSHFSCFYPDEDVAAGKPARQLEAAAKAGRFEDTGLRLRKDGSTFWANVVISAIRDRSGRLVGFGKITRDISARVAAEAQLVEAETRTRNLVHTIFSTMADGLVTIDARGIIHSSNATCREMFGRGSEDLTGRKLADLLVPQNGERLEAFLDEYRDTGKVRTVTAREATAVRPDGSRFPVEISIGVNEHDGEAHFVVVIRDITERHEAERQLLQAQKMESVGRLTGGIAHDFNNLLTVIIGNLEDVLMRAPEGLKQELASARMAAERSATLIAKLLAYSRRQVLEPEPVELGTLVRGLEDLLRRTLGEDIGLEFAVQEESWPAMADIAQVENAILNLVINSRDAMPNGGKLTIEVANAHLDADYAAQNAELAPGDYVSIAVTDTGTGMSPEVVERAFEPFFTTKSEGKGTGLGLPMIYGFAKQSGGHLKIYSEIGHGTTVRLYLPRHYGTADRRDAPVEREDERGLETILVVEDEDMVRGLMVSQLRSLGYDVLEANSGPEALRILAEDRKIDLVLTDVVMPGGITGRELGEEAKRMRPDIKMLYASGYTEDSITHQGKLDPGVIFIAKPFRRHDLAHKVREALEAE
mgnify:CR=1 FL=1